MGAGTFDYTSSATRAAMRASTGTNAFTHDDDVRAGRAPALHPTLDLTKKPRRESRDVAGKAPATPILVLCDVTGSMRQVPAQVIQDLAKLMKLIIENGVVTDPQICFGAIGDATCDRVPVQMGEFEADDQLAEGHLANLFLEGGGGGQTCESYELFLWHAGHQIDTDAWEKRGQKGFLFIIGDEAPYGTIDPGYVKRYMGADLAQPMTLGQAADAAQAKWELFLLRPQQGSYANHTEIRAKWLSVLPAERVIEVERWEEIVPLIAGTISVMAGEDIHATVAAMAAAGFDGSAVDAAARALVPLSSAAAPLAGGLVPVGSGDNLPSATRL